MVYNIKIGRREVEHVSHFKYLGSVKTSTANCTADVKARIGMAKGRMIELQDQWKDKKSHNRAEDEICQDTGMECTSLQNLREPCACWRRLLNITWKDKRTNRCILQELGVKRELLGELVKRKLI